MVFYVYQQTIEEVIVLGTIEAATIEAALENARNAYRYRKDAVLGLATSRSRIPTASDRRLSLGWRYVNTKGREKLAAGGGWI